MADLPKLQEISGELGGLKGRLRFNAQTAALRTLQDRIDEAEGITDQLLEIVDDHERAIKQMIEGRGNAS